MSFKIKALLLPFLITAFIFSVEAAPRQQMQPQQQEEAQDYNDQEEGNYYDPQENDNNYQSPMQPDDFPEQQDEVDPEQIQQQEPPFDGPSMQLQLKNEWPLAKGKFEMFVRAFSGKNKSKPVQIPVESYNMHTKSDVIFENITGDITAVQFSVRREGNSLQHFCEGKLLKEGKVRGLPEEVLVILSEPNSHYMTSDNELRNDAYPICTVGVRIDSSQANSVVEPEKKPEKPKKHIKKKGKKGKKKNKK